MAEKGKKKGGGGDKPAAKKAEAEKPAEKPVEQKQPKKAELKRSEHAEEHEKADDHGHAGHDAAHDGAHGHKPDIREYFVIFAVLFVLTVIEVGVTKVPGIARGLMILALMLLAVSKAAIVALFYMHLKHETKVLKLTVALPVAAPAVYALVLMSEAAWRFRF
jgi:cytochrome c oxidase subunit 4